MRFRRINEQARREAQQKIELKLKDFSHLEEQELFETLDASERGLSEEVALERLEENGKNLITTSRKNTVLKRLFEALVNPFNIVLIVIAGVSYFTDIVASSKPDYLTIFIILGLVLVSSGISFIQGERSNAAAEKLSKLVTNYSDVLRDGKYIPILIEDVVTGDIVKLSAGDMIPADVRFLNLKDTFVTQAALTGESQPVEKFVKLKTESQTITDLENLGFMGSNIVSGSATAIVLATGNDTYFGSMAQSLSGDKAERSFERGITAVSKLLIRLTLLIVPIILLINGFYKKDWISALLFSVSVAVGLTPEMLPVIITSTLAKGAVSMSKHKVIVKSLGSIQAFGEMDILCTDKTGTLTEDKIVLERYMDLRGEDDKRVLRHAFLNSYFQTGLKNLIDLAIIERAHKVGLTPVIDRYVKVDEIPFDFSRRRMSVVLKDETGKRQLITKGAVEEMMSVAKFIEIDGKVETITPEYEEIAMATYEKYNKQGLRILAVAQKNEVPDEHVFGVQDESALVIIGFVGFLDPPKESAKEAIEILTEHGVRTIVLTGDSEGVTAKVCEKIGIDASEILLGSDVALMDDPTLEENLKTHDVFAKLSPSQKERIVASLQKLGHTVGFLGDGINDAQALHQADVGISVDNAVDIAKETADIILLEKDLLVLEEGVIEGRKTFGNITKYIKMAVSGNFGNMFAVLIASIFLPFLPMMPIHILTQNLLNDFSQIGMSFDNVDESYLLKPRKWDSKGIRNFTFIMGPLSSIFDILCFAVLWWIIGANSVATQTLFQTGWFVFGTISQILVIYTIRTKHLPFIQSKPAKFLTFSTLTVMAIALLIGFTDISKSFEMTKLPLQYIYWLLGLVFLYVITTEIVKRLYVKKYDEWI
jgi:Mg2+-importing ATPase